MAGDLPESEDILGEPPPLAPHDPRAYLLTARTAAGARLLAENLSGPGEVWEFDGVYYAVKRSAPGAAWLADQGASLIPPADDALHMELDAFLVGLQRADQGRSDP